MFCCRRVRTNLVVVSLILVVLLSVKTSNANSELDGVLKLTISSITWEFDSKTENYASFDMYINITIDNISDKAIETYFPDSCKFDSYINYQLNDSSLTLTTHGNDVCLFVILGLICPPGATLVLDYERVNINDSSLTTLPNGYYELVVGEQFTDSNSYFESEARTTFQIYDNSSFITLPERPTYQLTEDTYTVLTSLILLPILFRFFRRKRNNSRFL